jgi:outer membrane protein assembly factor BamB
VRGTCAFVLVVLASASGGLAADWPQWRGAARDGRAGGLEERSAWPEGLAPAWKVTVGEGHSSPVVVGERVYVFSREGEDEVVRSLELVTGAEVWRQSYPAHYEINPAASGHGKGPKGTPVVEAGRICTLGISGILSCFDTSDGRLLWQETFASQFSQTAAVFGTAMSPVFDDGRLIAHVGGPAGGALSAFDSATGEVVWTWTGDGPGYASPVVAEIGGERQVVTLSESFQVGVSAKSGTLLWKLPFTTSYQQNAVTPIVHGDTVIYSGLDQPVRALSVQKGDSGWTTEPVWENDTVAAYMSTPVLSEGRLFGFSHKKRGQFFALDATTGKTLWLSDGRQGDNAAIVAGGGVLFLLTSGSELIVATQTSEAFSPTRTWPVAESPTWAHPVVMNDGVLVKDKDTLALLRFDAAPAAGAVALPPPTKGVEMSWIFFVVGAFISWGLYGPMIHKGQVALGNPLRAFLFVGLAYFLVGVLVPLAALAAQGELKGFTGHGMTMALVAGTLGATGALCVVYSFKAGGNPLWVMPLVFAGAPIVNVLYSRWEHPPTVAPSPMLYVGFLRAASGAYMVLHYKPQG